VFLQKRYSETVSRPLLGVLPISLRPDATGGITSKRVSFPIVSLRRPEA
jgi:hypothetical protein